MGRGRSEKQKQKLLYMAQLLYGRTDEDHPVTTQEVIDYLEADGIRSERKTVYTDMEELEDFGLDIIRVKERPGGFIDTVLPVPAAQNITQTKLPEIEEDEL